MKIMRMERTQITISFYFLCVHLLISATMGIRLPRLSRELGIEVRIFIAIKI